MRGSQPITFTRAEVEALADFAATASSKVRTYRVQRDTRNVLWVCNPDGTLARLTPLAVRR